MHANLSRFDRANAHAHPHGYQPSPLPSLWPPSAGRSPAPSPSAAAPRPRPWWWSPNWRDGTARGRGECVPYARYGESVESVMARDRGDAAAHSPAASTARGLQQAMPAGRRAQRARLRVLGPGGQAQRPAGARTRRPARARAPLTTAFTISLGEPEAMAAAAAKARRARAAQDQARRRRRGDDRARIAAVRAAAPAGGADRRCQ